MADFLAGLAIFLAVFLLAALDPHPARPQPAAGAAQPDPRPMQGEHAPASMGGGSLLLHAAPSAGGNTPRATARHLGTEAEITVTGPVARAVVTQTFRNTGGKRMEGVYAFPLPGDAAVDTLRMRIGERIIDGEIRSRAEARKLSGRSGESGAGIVPSQGRAAVFTSAVPAIAPGDTVTVRIEYQQTLQPVDGVHSLRFPLAATPRPPPELLAYGGRYSGGTGTRGLTRGAQSEGGRVPRPRLNPKRHDTGAPVSLRVRLEPGFPLGAVESPSHAVAVERRGEDAALITLEAPPLSGETDFELTWKPGETAEPTARLFREEDGKPGYLLATIAPPTRESALPEQPREVVFVLDRSGSMAGAAFRQARDSLAAAVSRLDPGDRFNIIAFDTGHEALFETPVAATESNMAVAKDFVARLVAGGGTRLTPTLSRTLDDARRDDTTRVRQVVLITDAAVDTPQQFFSEIAVKRGRSRLFPIGIGPAPDKRLLRRAAEIGRGESLHIGRRERIGARMTRFLERLEKPVLTDLEIVWPKEVKARTSPEPLPDLYAGRPLAISARTGTAKGRITVSGKYGGKPWSAEFELGEAKTGPGIARLWARRRIASLEALGLHTRRENGGIDADIEKVALRHGLVSRMTRLVAVERAPAAPVGVGEETSSGLSAEAAYDTVYGTASMPRAVRLRQGAQGASRSVAATYIIAPGPDAAAAGDTPATVTGGTGTDAGSEAQKALEGMNAFPSERIVAIGVMALLFAAMSTLTLGLWRHLSRIYLPTGRRRKT